ncbi:hypothetical protein AGR6A_Cc80157 [Agrobacterium sp. NCPPB 925]|nr:hypothetical protein AGR6A_Cc80157 [Agrobacterium sp. NCPPB 925]
MTPVQSQALDLLAKIFIWTVKGFALAFGISIAAGIIAAFFI